MKHPTLKSVRQGQTIYLVYGPGYASIPDISQVFICSNNIPDPEEGSMYSEIPVRQVKNWITIFGNKNLYYSRRKAESYVKNNY